MLVTAEKAIGYLNNIASRSAEWIKESNTPFTRSKNYQDRDIDCNVHYDLDRDPEDRPVYTGYSLFDRTKRITLLFIVQSLLHRNALNIWIKII